MDDKYRISRKEAIQMDELVSLYIRNMKLNSGLNNQRVFAAWDKISGAARFTIGKFYRNGVLYCTISSSVVRNQLYFQKEALVEAINRELEEDSLFTKDYGFVKSLVLK